MRGISRAAIAPFAVVLAALAITCPAAAAAMPASAPTIHGTRAPGVAFSGAAAGAPLACNVLTDHCPLWGATYDGPAGGFDQGAPVAVDPHGSRVFAGGFVAMPGTARAGVVQAYDQAGTVLWTVRRAPAAPRNWAETTALEVSPDGETVYAVGVSHDISIADCVFDVSAYQAGDGAQRWSAEVPIGSASCSGYWNQLPDAALSPDGRRLYVSGTVTTDEAYKGRARLRGLTTAFDTSTGTVAWRQPADDVAYGRMNWRLAVSADDHVYVSSAPVAVDSDSGILNPTEWDILAFDGADGASLWSARYDCTRVFGAPSAPHDYKFCQPPSDVVAAGGRVFVAGSNSQINNGTTETAAFSAADGSPLWHGDDDDRDGFIYALNRALVAGPDVVVTGHVRLGPFDPVLETHLQPPQYVLVGRSASTGKILWTDALPAGQTDSYCAGCGPQLTADPALRTVYFAGSWPLGQSLLTAGAYDGATGATAWSATTAWTPESVAYAEYPQGAALSADGSLLAFGGTATGAKSCATGYGACTDMAAMAFQP